MTTVSCLVATQMTGRIINISSAEGSSVTTGHPHCCQWNNEANCRHSQLKMEPDTAAECTIHKIWGQEEVWRSILYYWWPVNTRRRRFSQFMCRLPKCPYTFTGDHHFQNIFKFCIKCFCSIFDVLLFTQSQIKHTIFYFGHKRSLNQNIKT